MIQIYEGDPSRESVYGDNGSVVLNWVVLGTRDDLAVKRLVKATTAPLYDGLHLQNITAKENAPEAWECQARYGVVKPVEANTYKFTFDTTGGTQRITQSLETVTRYSKGWSTGKPLPADHKGAIGVTDHGVDGCNIVVPKFAWTEIWQLPVDVYDWSYAQKLKAITGRVNATDFRGFPAGQVLFHGGRGSGSSKDPTLIEISYSFEQSDDVGPITIGDIEQVIKLGWQYLWVHYVETHDATANAIARRPDGVYVERVYDTAPFGLLGIGS